jgi:hypothetical protein
VIHDDDAEREAVQHGHRGLTSHEERGDAPVQLIDWMPC